MSVRSMRLLMQKNMSRAPGIGMHRRDDSISFLDSRDQNYQLRHVVGDLILQAEMHAGAHYGIEQETAGMNAAQLRDYWIGKGVENPEDNQRVEDKAAILLARMCAWRWALICCWPATRP